MIRLRFLAMKPDSQSPRERASTESGCGDQGPSSRSFRRNLFIAAVLLLFYVLQCAWFVETQSITFDESIHTAVGQDVWRNHRFNQWMETPPLGHLLVGFPIRGDKFQMQIQNPGGWLVVTALAPSAERFIRGPRIVNIALGVLLGVLVWCAAQQLFSASAANFALTLFAFSPQLIAHFSVATVDGIAVLTVFAVAFLLVQWRKDPSWSKTLLLGLILGLALLAKFYAPPFVVLAVLAMLLTRRKRTNEGGVSGGFTVSPSAWSWRSAVAAIALAALVVWSGYFLHVGHATLHGGQLTIDYPEGKTIVNAHGLGLDLSFPLPAPEFFAGFNEVMEHNRLGHPSFLLGRVYRDAVPHWYFPVAIVLKWPTITLLLALAGLVLMAAFPKLIWSDSGPGSRIDAGIYATFAALAVLLALWARLGIGDRHVLTLFPFLLIFSAACWQWACRRACHKKIALGMLALLAVLNTVDVLRYAPGYLSYFNIFVPAERTHELLTDSSLDWGQGLLALSEYQRQHPDTPLHLAYFGSISPQLYGIQATTLRPSERVTGKVVVSATLLSGQYLRDPNAYHWLLQFKPVAILDHCLLVFDVPQTQSN
jgi:hypothetical protein